MDAANHNAPATPPTTPPATGLSKSQILTNVLSLATQFGTCVEAFNLIHPHKDSDHDQKVALAKLGIQQGRLLIFGDAVGISSPPATIARHMVPSHPGITNPDPHLPVNFGVRDPKLDEEGLNKKVRAALTEIEGRPSHLTREELMEKYGLKSPKRFASIEHPALDTNRLEAFREKYGLLQDLVRQSGIRAGARQRASMTMSHWTVRDVDRFEEFVKTVRVEVDGLVALLDVKEQVDRGMRTDIKAMAWHPDLSGPVVRSDWEKLRLIREAVADDYPEYVEVADRALKYISEELKGTHLANMRPSYAPVSRRKSDDKAKPRVSEQPVKSPKTPDKEKRPGFLSHFKLKSWSKSQNQKSRSKSIAQASLTEDEQQDPQRSLSADLPSKPVLEQSEDGLERMRSKSLSAIPDAPAPFNLDSRLQGVPVHDEDNNIAPSDNNGAPHADDVAPKDDNNAFTADNVPPTATQDSTKEENEKEKDSAPSDTNLLTATPTHSDDMGNLEAWEKSPLVHADTARSLVDRHDMYRGVGRIETRDIRERSHEAAGA